MVDENYKIYKSRIEPKVLARLADGKPNFYPSIRTITDTSVLESLVREVENCGKDHVVVSWITPPYGTVIGYGLYSKEDANNLLGRSKKERWSSPDVGRIYDLNRLKRKLGSLKTKACLHI